MYVRSGWGLPLSKKLQKYKIIPVPTRKEIKVLLVSPLRYYNYFKGTSNKEKFPWPHLLTDHHTGGSGYVWRRLEESKCSKRRNARIYFASLVLKGILSKRKIQQAQLVLRPPNFRNIILRDKRDTGKVSYPPPCIFDFISFPHSLAKVIVKQSERNLWVWTSFVIQPDRFSMLMSLLYTVLICTNLSWQSLIK